MTDLKWWFIIKNIISGIHGITKALVNVNQYIKAGQVIGTYTFGQEMEFRMYKDEEPMDPREFLECKPKQEENNGGQK